MQLTQKSVEIFQRPMSLGLVGMFSASAILSPGFSARAYGIPCLQQQKLDALDLSFSDKERIVFFQVLQILLFANGETKNARMYSRRDYSSFFPIGDMLVRFRVHSTSIPFLTA